MKKQAEKRGGEIIAKRNRRKFFNRWNNKSWVSLKKNDPPGWRGEKGNHGPKNGELRESQLWGAPGGRMSMYKGGKGKVGPNLGRNGVKDLNTPEREV